MLTKISDLSLSGMKSLAAIFLFCVFALSQYAKRLAYMECKLDNLMKSSEQPCDCEKKYDIHILNDKEPVGSQTHFHSLVDEFYSAPANKEIINCYTFLSEKSSDFSSVVCNGSYSTLYRPPQA